MERLFLFTVLFSISACLPAQREQLSLVLGGGPSCFFNDPGLRRSVNYSTLLGARYLIGNKKRAVAFHPGIHLLSNKYHTRGDNRMIVFVTQRAISAHLDVLLRLRKKTYLRAGIFVNAVYRHSVNVGQLYRNSINYSFSNNDIMRPYSGTSLQAGINLGLCLPLRWFQRNDLLGIQLHQAAAPLVHSDYVLNKSLIGVDINVLSRKARPTLLLLTLEFSLARKEKKKTATNDEE